MLTTCEEFFVIITNQTMRHLSQLSYFQYQSVLLDLEEKKDKPSIRSLRSPSRQVVHDANALTELFATSFVSLYTSGTPES